MKTVFSLLRIAALTTGIFIMGSFKQPHYKEINVGGIVEFNDANFESKALKSGKLTVVDFWAEWCGPCRKVSPIVEELATQYAGKVNIGKLDVDNSPLTCEKYSITSIPTLLFIKNGKVVDKMIGSASKKAIEKKIIANM